MLGGGGFIGSHLCDALIAAGHEVAVFEKAGCNKASLPSPNKLRWIEGDFINPEHLKTAVQSIDIVFHLISTTLPQNSNDSPAYDVASNVVPTLNLLDAAYKAGVKKIIFFSSGGTVYGIPRTIPITEEHSTMPICSYGIHKLMIEKYLALYDKLYNLDYAVLRVSNPYGERQRVTGGQGAVTIFIYKALAGEPIEIWGDGSVVRDYLHVADLVRAATTLMTLKTDPKIFNIGSGTGISLNDMIRLIEESTGLELNARYTSARGFDVPVNILDISRARKVFNWSPQIDFSEGIDRTASYLRMCIRNNNIC